MTWDGVTERRSFNLTDVVAHMATTNECLKNVDSTLSELKDKVGKQNGRIAKLENWRNFIVGGLAAIGTLIGLKH